MGGLPPYGGHRRHLLSSIHPLLVAPVAGNDDTFLLVGHFGRPLAPGPGGAGPQSPGLGLVLERSLVVSRVVPDHCGGALPVVLGPAGNAAPNRRAEETERQAWSPTSGEWGTGQGHRGRDSSPGRVGGVQPVRNRDAAVGGCGVGPDEQPAGPFPLDSTNHWCCRPLDDDWLLAPLATYSPRGLTPALSFWMQHFAAAVTTTKPPSPRTRAMWDHRDVSQYLQRLRHWLPDRIQVYRPRVTQFPFAIDSQP